MHKVSPTLDWRTCKDLNVSLAVVLQSSDPSLRRHLSISEFEVAFGIYWHFLHSLSRAKARPGRLSSTEGALLVSSKFTLYTSLSTSLCSTCGHVGLRASLSPRLPFTTLGSTSPAAPSLLAIIPIELFLLNGPSVNAVRLIKLARCTACLSKAGITDVFKIVPHSSIPESWFWVKLMFRCKTSPPVFDQSPKRSVGFC